MSDMIEFVKSECATSNSERAYFRFLADLGDILGRHISLGADAESNAYDLYADGCDASEVAAEFEVQGW